MITRFKIWFGLKLCDFGLCVYSLQDGDAEDEREREKLREFRRKFEAQKREWEALA